MFKVDDRVRQKAKGWTGTVVSVDVSTAQISVFRSDTTYTVKRDDGQIEELIQPNELELLAVSATA